MKRTIFIVFILALTLLGAYRLGAWSNRDQLTQPSSTTSPVASPSLSPMEEHMKVLDDGHTVMMMGGTYNPKVIQVSPGASIKVLNHETRAMALMSDDHETFATSFIEAGGEEVFTAPTQPGSYPFHLHPQGSDQLISGGVLIVEM